MAHMFARLRIADPISGIVARLTTGSGGLTLGRTGFAPTGRQTKFPEVIASSFPFDPHCLVALVCLDLESRLGNPPFFATAPVYHNTTHSAYIAGFELLTAWHVRNITSPLSWRPTTLVIGKGQNPLKIPPV